MYLLIALASLLFAIIGLLIGLRINIKATSKLLHKAPDPDGFKGRATYE